MFRTTSLEVNLRRQEQLREAEYRRWADQVRRQDRRPSTIERALGRRLAAAR